MKIAVVCFPSVGGSGVVATAQAVGLARRGHEVHLISRAPPARLEAERDNLTFHRVELEEYPLFESPPYTLALASTLIDVARAERLDVIHVHYAVPHAASAQLARQALAPHAPKIVTSLHGTDVVRIGIHPAYRSATVFSVGQSDAVIVPSRYLAEEARRLLEVPLTRQIEVIPNFVDTERFAPPSGAFGSPLEQLFDASEAGSPVLFHVSNFRAVKRVKDVIEALARLRRRLPARLVLVGEGPERAAAEEQVRALGLQRSVHFAGRRDSFVGDLGHASAFLLASETESFGLAALEAMSAGVPVFGYRVGGLPELVTPDVGTLVEPFDVEALAGAMGEVLADPERHAHFRRAARARAVEQFRAEPALDRYEAYLHQVLEGKTK